MSDDFARILVDCRFEAVVSKIASENGTYILFSIWDLENEEINGPIYSIMLDPNEIAKQEKQK